MAKLEAKIRMIEGDPLFDRFVAEQQWKVKRIAVEKELAAAKKEAKPLTEDTPAPEENGHEPSEGDGVADEAERIAAEILAENGSDDDLGGLFDSLPQDEVDEATGKTQTVINSADGTKLVVRNFGKWTGYGPKRALEEACRSR